MRCSVILQKYFGKLGDFLYVVQLIHRPTESQNKLYNIHKGASLHMFSFPLLAHGPTRVNPSLHSFLAAADDLDQELDRTDGRRRRGGRRRHGARSSDCSAQGSCSGSNFDFWRVERSRQKSAPILNANLLTVLTKPLNDWLAEYVLK